MKKILCYGDSNTWGQAEFEGRIADEKQWPNILQTQLPKMTKDGVYYAYETHETVAAFNER